MEINLNTKLEAAIEILATKIAMLSRNSDNIDNDMLILLKERNEMYKGNVEIINKIINEYGVEIKNY